MNDNEINKTDSQYSGIDAQGTGTSFTGTGNYCPHCNRCPSCGRPYGQIMPMYPQPFYPWGSPIIW